MVSCLPLELSPTKTKSIGALQCNPKTYKGLKDYH